MLTKELNAYLMQLSVEEKQYIIQILSQSLPTHQKNYSDARTIGERRLESNQKKKKFLDPKFYGCIDDDTFFRRDLF